MGGEKEHVRREPHKLVSDDTKPLLQATVAVLVQRGPPQRTWLKKTCLLDEAGSDGGFSWGLQ